MNVAICDDEKFFRRSLIETLKAYSRKKGIIFIYHEYCDGRELLETELDFDIIFMDYQMDGKNGIDTVAALRERKNDTHVIFISSYKDVVFESMVVKAFRFLVKPLDKTKLYEALDSVIKEKSTDFQILVKDDYNDKRILIPEKNIIYAQADNTHTIIVTTEGEYHFADTLSVFETKLSSDFFFRTHRSFIVNMRHIENYSRYVIVFTNQNKASLSRKKYKEFKTLYLEFLKRESLGSL